MLKHRRDAFSEVVTAEINAETQEMSIWSGDSLNVLLKHGWDKLSEVVTT